MPYVDHTHVLEFLSMVLHIIPAMHLPASLQNQKLSLIRSNLDTQIVLACISSLLPQCLCNLAFDKLLAVASQISDFQTNNIYK